MILFLPIGLLAHCTRENVTFQIGDIVRGDRDQLPTLFSRITEQIEIILCAARRVKQNLSRDGCGSYSTL
jgi:hypothetical protein